MLVECTLYNYKATFQKSEEVQFFVGIIILYFLGDDFPEQLPRPLCGGGASRVQGNTWSFQGCNCYFAPDRCVPNEKSRMMRPLDETSLVLAVPWTSRPLDEPSLGWVVPLTTVPWTRRPCDEASLGRCVPDLWVLKHFDRLSFCWVRLFWSTPVRSRVRKNRSGTTCPRDASSTGSLAQGPHCPRNALSMGENIQDFLLGDTSVGVTLSRHSWC